VAWNGHKKTGRLEKTLAEQKVIIKAAQTEYAIAKEEVPVPSQYFIPYYVRPGESLSLISYSFYGNSLDWERIYQANRDKIIDPDLLENKEIIMIPVDSVMKK
jgi:nucleoid-associated protein YgaU